MRRPPAHSEQPGVSDPDTSSRTRLAGFLFRSPKYELVVRSKRGQGCWRGTGSLGRLWSAWSPPRPEGERSALSAQVEQLAGLAHIESLESLLEPLVEREDHVARRRSAGTGMMQASEAHGGAQLE